MRAATAMAVLALGCLERGGGEGRQSADPPAPALDAVAERVEPVGPAVPGATIAVRLEAEPPHLNPLAGGGGLVARVVMGDVLEALLCRSGLSAPPAPCLAESYRVSSDGLTWRFRLRPGVRFHDGSELDPDDVVRSFDFVAPPDPAPTVLAALFDDLREIDVDGREIVFRFSGGRRDRAAAFAAVPIFPAERLSGLNGGDLASADESRWPIGTGPLRFVAWRSGRSIELQRFDAYWGTPAQPARVVHRITPERSRALAELRAGTLDVAAQLPIDTAIRWSREDSKLGFTSYSSPAYLALVFNTRVAALDSAAERRALVASIDREALGRELFFGLAPIATGPFVTGHGDPAVVPIPNDRGALRAFPDGTRLRLLVPAGSRTAERIADIWAADASGIEIEVVRLEYARLLTALGAGDFDIALMAYTSGADVDLYSLFHSSQIGAGNVSAISNSELDRALDAARSAVGADAIRRADARVHRLLDELQPFGFLFVDQRAAVLRDDIGGGEGVWARGTRELWRAR